MYEVRAQVEKEVKAWWEVRAEQRDKMNSKRDRHVLFSCLCMVADNEDLWLA